MPQPRLKIFTRSFDLRLYRIARGLFCGWKDASGVEVPCVRLTDRSADGYFYAMLQDGSADIAISIEEDCFVTDPQAVLDLVRTMQEGGYAAIGCSDGDPATTGRDPVAMSPFFCILNLSLIRTRFSRNRIIRLPEDYEPYYPFFRWLAATFPVLYLDARRHQDGISTVAIDPQGRTLCLHSWFSRFYGLPACVVRLFEPSQGRQKERIDALIAEVYAARSMEFPRFSLADRLLFFRDRIVRWCIKIPQRIAGWPGKIKRRIARKRAAKR